MMSRPAKPKAKGMGAATRRILALAGNPPDVDTAVMVIAEQLMGGIAHPPTDLEALGKRLNVSGFEAENMPLSGELRREGTQYRVFYSSYLSATQRRFTIAHELGHAVFASTGRNYPRTGEEVERICDMLAAEFLMPEPEFRRRLGESPTAERILDLAALFKVPLYSAAIRAAELQGVSVFTLENQMVIWAFGEIRKGPIQKNGFYLKTALESVTTSSGDMVFPMSGEFVPTQARLTWKRITNGNRAFCVLKRIQPPKRTAKHEDISVEENSIYEHPHV